MVRITPDQLSCIVLTNLTSLGGYLGFFCTHAYAHSNTDHIVLPDMLKGLDMVIWETLTGLGLQTEVKPVLFTDRSDCDYKGLDGDEFENKFPEAILGSDFRMYKDSYDRVDGWEELKGVYTGWGWDEDDIRYRNVHWLTEPGPMELQLLYKAVSAAFPFQTSLASVNLCVQIQTLTAILLSTATKRPRQLLILTAPSWPK